eukprot:m51a1_g587 hypothetical protein (246) ;mRNA; f:16472-17711
MSIRSCMALLENPGIGGPMAPLVIILNLVLAASLLWVALRRRPWNIPVITRSESIEPVSVPSASTSTAIHETSADIEQQRASESRKRPREAEEDVPEPARKRRVAETMFTLPLACVLAALATASAAPAAPAAPTVMVIEAENESRVRSLVEPIQKRKHEGRSPSDGIAPPPRKRLMTTAPSGYNDSDGDTDGSMSVASRRSDELAELTGTALGTTEVQHPSSDSDGDGNRNIEDESDDGTDSDSE